MIELTHSERQSAPWRKLMERFTTRLDALRIMNDGPKDATETAEIRGRIAEIKALMSMDIERSID